MGPDYVAFDLETTGLDYFRDSIIEIGAVRFNRDGVVATYEEGVLRAASSLSEGAGLRALERLRRASPSTSG